MIEATNWPIVCFSTQDWEGTLWTNKQHVMARLSQRHRVLYVEPYLWPLQWPLALVAAGQAGAPAGWLRQISDNLWVCSGRVRLPGYFRLAFGQGLTHRLNRRLFRRLAQSLGIGRPILWLYDPAAVEIVGGLGERLVVYDCVDEYAQFPWYALPERQRRLREQEQRLLKRADLVFVTSPNLYESKRPLNPNTYLVPNVADAEHFGKALEAETPVPQDIAAIPHPIVGFVGAVSAYKVDLELLGYLARAHPEWSIVLIGPIGVGDPTTDVAPLQRLPNVHLLGERSYAELPGYLKAFDACTIPYRLNSYTAHCFPLKVHEYLAAGKPVVSTTLPAIAHYQGLIGFADDYEGFARAVQEALGSSGQEAVARRVAVARQNTWEVKIEAMLGLIREHLEARRG